MANTATDRRRKKQHDFVENVKSWSQLMIDRRLFMLGNVKALKVAKQISLNVVLPKAW